MKIIKGFSFTIALTFASQAFAVDVLVSRLVDTPDPAVRGGEITYEIDVQNQQDDLALNVVLTVPLPATTEFVSVDNGACSHDGMIPGAVTCMYGNMVGTADDPPGPVETANVVVRSTAATGFTVDIEATATTDSPDTNPANDSLTQNTTIDDGADLIPLFISALPDPVIAGGDVSYTTQITNAGPNAAVNIQVVFQLSINMTYVAGSASGAGWSCSYNAGLNQLTCTRAGMGVGEIVADISFAGTVTGAQAGTLTTTATVSSDTGDPQPNNDVDTIDVTVTPGLDLAVTIISSDASVISGSALSVTARPRNLGPFDANMVEVVVTIPADFVIGVPSGPGWMCSVALQVVTCTRPSYGVGASDDILIPLTAPMVVVLTNVSVPVTISTVAGEEAAERMDNNNDSVDIRITPDGVDLSVSKSKTPQPVAVGSPIESTITVSNAGPQDALAGTITLTDTLPADEGFTSFSGTDWTCVDNTPDIDCTYNAVLPAGGTSSTLTINTIANAAGVLTNTAAVSYSGDPPDYDDSNDSAQGSVTATDAIADLVLTKTADADTLDGDDTTLAADPGPPEVLENTIVYTLTITNNGPDDADGIVLTDPIPGYVSGSTVVAVTSQPMNYTCTPGSTVVCTQDSGVLANGASDVFEISVSRPLFDGSQTNNASAFSTTIGDDDRNSNTASATVFVEPAVDVTVQSKTVTPNPVKSGVEATYVITIRNNGPSTAQDVQVIDTFILDPADPGFTFISESASGGGMCSGLMPGMSYTFADSPTLTCDMGSLINGETETITIVIRTNFMITPPDPRTMDNTVMISTSTLDTDVENDFFGPVTLVIEEDDIDLLINNSDMPDPVAWDPATGGDNPNNDVVYDVEFTNRGPSYATGVSYEYTMTPKTGKTVRFDCDEDAPGDACGTSLDTCSITGGSNPVTGPATLTLTCTATTVAGQVDHMTANSTDHRYLRFRILTQPDSTGDTHNTNATISANENEIILGNNSEAESTSVRARVDLEILGKVPSETDVQLDQPFLWTITLVNNGPLSSDETTLTDTLPAGMIFHGATPSWSNADDATNGTCDIMGSDLTCEIGFMSVDATTVITIPVMMDTFTQASVQNCSTAVTNGVDVIPANNTDICGTVTVDNSFFPSDYGDAPDTSMGIGPGDYPTTLDNGGPRHMQPGGTWLGACVDSDGDGTQQNVAATDDDVNAGPVEAGVCDDNDDEDGVGIPPALIAGQPADLDITISGLDCALDGWIDFNADGNFVDPGEQVFASLALAAGSYTETIAVPADLTIGTSYARFRCSEAGGLDPVEETTGGEVEDYLVSLHPDPTNQNTPVDYGDAPDPGPGTTNDDYRTLPLDNGASHVLGVVDAPYLGSCVDSDDATQQGIGAVADDLGTAGGPPVPETTGTCDTPDDDEDGVVFTSVIRQDSLATIDVTASAGTNACLLNAWIDYDANGDFSDAGEQIATDQPIAPGATETLTPTIPASVAIGATYARFRCNTAGGLASTGAAMDGEVEDYIIFVRPNLGLTPVDFGDAPDPTAAELVDDYTTTEANNGPSHVLLPQGAPYLGSCVDSDDGTAQGIGAIVDDTSPAAGLSVTVGSCAVANDDEDGVVLPPEFFPGTNTTVDIITGPGESCLINGWIDFNRDGDFTDPGEQFVNDILQAGGASQTYPVAVPPDAEEGDSYARVRCSTAPRLEPTGPAPDGEVEDHVVTILANAFFNVDVDFTDNNPLANADVFMQCAGSAFTISPDVPQPLGDNDMTEFTIGSFEPDVLACEVIVTDLTVGYVLSDASGECGADPTVYGQKYDCTLVFEPTSASFVVDKNFSDDNLVASTTVTLGCVDPNAPFLTVIPPSATASETVDAMFTVTHFDPGNTTCTATEIPVQGYTQEPAAADDCGTATVLDMNQGAFSCEIYNELNLATWLVNKDFTDDNPGSVTMTLVCDSGFVSPPVVVSEGNPGSFTLTGFNTDIYGPTSCMVVESNPPNDGYMEIARTADCDINPVEHEGEYLECVITNEPTLRVTFAVNKIFDDGNPGEVEVAVSCNTGLPLEQTTMISEGDPVEFVVVNAESGALDCTVTESVPPGYIEDYESYNGIDSDDDFDGCRWENIFGGESHVCDINNALLPVDVVVMKEWIDENPQFQNPTWAEITIGCNAPILDDCSQADGICGIEGDEIWTETTYIDPDNPGEFEVLPHWDGSTFCSVSETLEPGVIQDADDCSVIPLLPGQGGECTIINTRFYEGIPTLSQYTLALLALMMLGVGLVGFRRFA